MCTVVWPLTSHDPLRHLDDERGDPVVAYLDSSVLLRHILLGEEPIRHAMEFPRVVSSELIEIECRRVLHRYLLAGELTDQTLPVARERLDEVLAGIDLLELSQIKQRAMDPFPVNVRTLERAARRDRACGYRGRRHGGPVLARRGHEPLRQEPRPHHRIEVNRPFRCDLSAGARSSTSSAHWFRLLPDSSAASAALRCVSGLTRNITRPE